MRHEQRRSSGYAYESHPVAEKTGLSQRDYIGGTSHLGPVAVNQIDGRRIDASETRATSSCCRGSESCYDTYARGNELDQREVEYYNR